MAPTNTQGLDNDDMWLRTGEAAHALGVSEDTLKRYAQQDEFLIEGVHWVRGLHLNSPILWNVPACEEAILWRGRRGKRDTQAGAKLLNSPEG